MASFSSNLYALNKNFSKLCTDFFYTLGTQSCIETVTYILS